MAGATTTDSVQLLRQAFSAVLEPGQPGYDEARRIHNGLIDKHPAVIARCLHTADVVAAVDFARDERLEISVRGGGHNVAGKAVNEGGLMIDLSPMKGVQVDIARQTVRAQPGLTIGELDRATAAFGLAVPSGIVSSVGIAGLTLGGGLGWLQGKYGLAVDNLLSAEVVLASGDVVVASGDTEEELFWALRGGGGNFGVVTSFEFRALPPRRRARRRGAVAARGGADGLLVLPRVLGRPARRPVSAGHPRPRARRIGGQGVRDCLLSRGRRRRAGRCRPAAAA